MLKPHLLLSELLLLLLLLPDPELLEESVSLSLLLLLESESELLLEPELLLLSLLLELQGTTWLPSRHGNLFVHTLTDHRCVYCCCQHMFYTQRHLSLRSNQGHKIG